MAEKVSQKDELEYPLRHDDTLYIIRDGASYKAKIGDLFRGFLKFVPGYEGYVQIPADGNVDPASIQADDLLLGKGEFYSSNHVSIRAKQDDPSQDSEFQPGMDIEE